MILALTQRFSALESRLNNLGSGAAPAPAKAAAPAPAEEDDDDDDVDLFGSDDEDDAEAERIKVRFFEIFHIQYMMVTVSFRLNVSQLMKPEKQQRKIRRVS